MSNIGKVCPECGISLEGLNAKAHSFTHWPEYLDPARSSNLARVRQKQCNEGGVTPAEYTAAHKEV